MSRSYKDVKYKFSQEATENKRSQAPVMFGDYGEIPYFRRTWWFDVAGARIKKKRSHRELHRMPTPMWWIHDYMNVPQRVASNQWERKIVQCNVEDLEECDPPIISRKPHKYYW